MKEKLVVLMQKMADFTEPECRKNCKIPQSCCSTEYCEMAIEIAGDEWDVELQRTGHPTLPLMGPNGCTAAPHFRPLCTLHVCSINNLGFKPNDSKWTKEYYKLRNQIDRCL